MATANSLSTLSIAAETLADMKKYYGFDKSNAYYDPTTMTYKWQIDASSVANSTTIVWDTYTTTGATYEPARKKTEVELLDERVKAVCKKGDL